MTKKPITNMPDSIRQRLLNKARETGRPYDEFLKYYAIERFLYRLGQSEHSDRLILKGGLTLRVWDAPLSRPTLDIDVLARLEGEVAVTEAVRECLRLELPDDGLQFDEGTIRIEPIRAKKEVPGVRLLIPATLGTTRIQVQMDVGFDDEVEPPSEPLDFPTLLNQPAPHLYIYPPEVLIAEKFQALIALDLANTRLKDFYDIWLLAQRRTFQGERLALALKTTFAKRRTPLPTKLPAGLTPAFYDDSAKARQWLSFLSQNRLAEVNLTLPEVAAILARFLMPPAVGATGTGFSLVWDFQKSVWGPRDEAGQPE